MKADAPTPAPKPAETPLDPDLTYPKVEIPKNLRTDPKLPPLELPKEPDMKLVPKVPAVGHRRTRSSRRSHRPHRRRSR